MTKVRRTKSPVTWAAVAAAVALAGPIVGGGLRSAAADGGHEEKAATFTTTGSMLVAREGGGAGNSDLDARLPDGRVLVAGGYSNTGPFKVVPTDYLAESEVYDPATGTWTVTGSMHETRFGHVVQALPTGLVLAAGGYGGGAIQNPKGGVSPVRATAELYNPATGTWTATAAMHHARELMAVAMLPSGKVLVSGGIGLDGFVEKTAELYDPASGTWTEAADMHQGRWTDSATVLADGRVLVSGGRVNDVRKGATETITSSAEIYDPAHDTWTVTGAMHLARAFQATGLLSSGQVIAAGGKCKAGPGCAGPATRSAELFDPQAVDPATHVPGAWKAAADMHAERIFAASAVLSEGGPSDSGGSDGRSDNQPRLEDRGPFVIFGGGEQVTAERYNAEGNTWTVIGSMAHIRDDAQPVALRDGSYLIPGGFQADATSYTTTATAEIFHPQHG